MPNEMVRMVEVTPVNIHQSILVLQLFEQLRCQDLQNAALLITDSAYDDKKTHSKTINLELLVLVTYNSKRSKIESFDCLNSLN